MPRNSLRLLMLLGALPVMQCETPIDFPAETRASEIGVISEFTLDKTLEVRVFEGKFLFEDAETNYLENATVSIYQGDSFLEYLVLDREKVPPSYVSRTLIPEPNVEYRIQVVANGFEPAMARSKVPNSTPINQVTISDILYDEPEVGSGNGISYLVAVNFADPGEEANFYHLNFTQEVWRRKQFKDDSDQMQPEMRKVTFSSDQNNNRFIAFPNGGLLFSDEGFDGEHFDNVFSMHFDLEDDQHLGKLHVELRSVSEEYYLFQTSLSRQGSNPGQPIDDGVSIYNNIENGRGIFAGYNIFQTSVEIGW